MGGGAGVRKDEGLLAGGSGGCEHAPIRCGVDPRFGVVWQKLIGVVLCGGEKDQWGNDQKHGVHVACW